MRTGHLPGSSQPPLAPAWPASSTSVQRMPEGPQRGRGMRAWHWLGLQPQPGHRGRALGSHASAWDWTVEGHVVEQMPPGLWLGLRTKPLGPSVYEGWGSGSDTNPSCGRPVPHTPVRERFLPLLAGPFLSQPGCGSGPEPAALIWSWAAWLGGRRTVQPAPHHGLQGALCGRSPAGLGAHEGGLSRVSGLQVGCRGGSCALPAGQSQSPSSSSSHGAEHAKKLLLVLKAEALVAIGWPPKICSHGQHNPMLYLSLCRVSAELGGRGGRRKASWPPSLQSGLAGSVPYAKSPGNFTALGMVSGAWVGSSRFERPAGLRELLLVLGSECRAVVSTRPGEGQGQGQHALNFCQAWRRLHQAVST